MKLKLTNIARGKSAVLTNVDDEMLSLELLHMGCLPGETIQVERIAALGDPIMISVEGNFLSLRKKDAEKMDVTAI